MCMNSELIAVMECSETDALAVARTDLVGCSKVGAECNNLLANYLNADGSESLSLLAEYFGVALVFAALGSLLRGVHESRFEFGFHAPSPEIEGTGKVVLKKLLTGATKRLRILALKARALEDELNQQTTAYAETLEGLEAVRSENIGLWQKIDHAESQADELRKRRAEDARANEKVVSIFATHEQGWKNERKKLKHEVQKLRHELQTIRVEQRVRRHKSHSAATVQGEEGCDECVKKDALVTELKDRLGEQEFIMMATMEEAKAEQQERNGLVGKLAVADAMVSDLSEKLAKEVEERARHFQKHQSTMGELRSKQRQMEMEMSQILEELETSKRDIEIFLEEKKRADKLTGRLSLELNRLQNDIHEKEEVISAMLRKSSADVEEKHELRRELAVSKAKRKHAEAEKEKWKRLVEDKTRSCSARDMFRPRSSFGSRVESGFDIAAEMQRLHDVEVQNLQSVYGEQVEALQNSIRLYQERVADLEQNILLHMSESKKILSLPERDGAPELEMPAESSVSKAIIPLRESDEVDAAPKLFQRSASKDLLVQYTDANCHQEQQADKWKRLYLTAKATIEMLHKGKESTGSRGRPRLQDWLAVEKARDAARLEQRHWQEIDAFERQMRAKDERMEAFRQQLLTMENDAKQRLEDLEAVNKTLQSAKEENQKFKVLLEEKEELLKSYRERIIQQEDCSSPSQIFEATYLGDSEGEREREIEILQGEIRTYKKLMREKDLLHESKMMKVVEEAEAELQEKDFRLAVIEAKVVQAQIEYEKEKKIKEKILCEVMKEKNSAEMCLRNQLSYKTEVKDAINAACLEVQKLAKKVEDAQEQMLQVEEQHENYLKELVEQVLDVSKSNCPLRYLKGMLWTTKENGKLLLGKQPEQVGWGTECYNFKEHMLGEYVSDVDPGWLPLEISVSMPSNLPKIKKVFGESFHRFQSGLVTVEEGDETFNMFDG